jgi:zinc transporter 5/7
VGVVAGLFAVLIGVFRKRLSAREAAGKDDGKKDGEGDRFVGLAALGAAALLTPLSLVWDGPLTRSVPVTAWHHLLAAVVLGTVGLVGAYFADQWFARRVEDPGVAAPVAAGSVLAALAGLFALEALPAPSLPLVAAALLMLVAVTLATRGTQDSLDLLLPVDASHHGKAVSSAPAGRAFNPYPARSWQSVAHSVVANADSRRIFIFLCINFTFMFVEFVYGFYTNSLSLISDASHMLFDCMALAIGLVAAVVSKWETDHQYSYGYGRFEVLSGFCNGLLLVFIAAFVLMEGVERLIDPPVVHTENLMTVAVCGFCVNLVGLYAFHDFGGEGHENDNMHGVFLHILADTLGSLGVILSAFLMQMYDFRLADPIASLFISILITLSVIPLLKHSGQTLLQRTPSHLEKRFDEGIRAILATPGVLVVRDPHCWLLQGTDSVATATVQVHESVPEAAALATAFAIMKSKGFRHVAIQVEKGEPLDQLAVTHYGEDVMHNGHSHSHAGGHSHDHGPASAHNHAAHSAAGSCSGHSHDHSGHSHGHHDEGHHHAHPYSPVPGEYRTIAL